MKMSSTKQGFTIIEVVLVLAIAGLIFLMVFVAFPALQRNQRDTQRRQDIANFSAQLKSLSANGIDVASENSPMDTTNPTNKVSTCATNAKNIGTLNKVVQDETDKQYFACYILRNYTDNATNTNTSSTTTDPSLFNDPSGPYYRLYISDSKPADGSKYYKMTANYYIVVSFNTKCDNSTYKVASFDNNPYAYTVRYKMESGDIFCQEGSLK